MKKLVASVCLCASSVAFSEGDSHLDAAYKLLEVSNTEKTLTQSIDQMAELELQNNPALLPYRDILRNFYAEVLSFESLKDDYAYIYMDHFTEAEIRELIEFHQSEIGQKLVASQPIIVRQTAELGQERVMNGIGDLRVRIEDEAMRIAREKELGQID